MEKLNQELILKLQEGKIAVENTGTKKQLYEVIKEACPKDVDCDIAENVYYIVSGGLWSGNATTNMPSVPIQEFYMTENVLSQSYDELLRQNREMREFIQKTISICDLFRFPTEEELKVVVKAGNDCLTSCNKGKE